MSFPLNGLAAYWSLDELMGLRFDRVGSAHLTAYNGASAGTGKLKRGVHLSQVNAQYLGTGDIAPIDTGNIDFTLTAWVQPATAGQMVVVGKDAITGRDYLLDISPTQTARFSVSRNSGAAEVESVATIPVGAWSFLVAIHNAAAKTIQLVVNAGPVVTVSTNNVPPNVSAAELRIGSRAAAPIAEYFDGDIDEVGLWKRALTVPEVAALWNGGAGEPYPPPTLPMTLMEAIRTRLLSVPEVVALVQDRVSVLLSQQSAISRSVRLQEISRDDFAHLRGASDLRPSRVQVDAFVSKGDGDAYTIAHAITDAVRGRFEGGVATGLVGFRGVVGEIAFDCITGAGTRELFDADDRQVVRVLSEYFVWFKHTGGVAPTFT